MILTKKQLLELVDEAKNYDDNLEYEFQNTNTPYPIIHMRINPMNRDEYLLLAAFVLTMPKGTIPKLSYDDIGWITREVAIGYYPEYDPIEYDRAIRSVGIEYMDTISTIRKQFNINVED